MQGVINNGGNNGPNTEVTEGVLEYNPTHQAPLAQPGGYGHPILPMAPAQPHPIPSGYGQAPYAPNNYNNGW